MRVSEGKSIDDILASIMEGKSDEPEIFETLKTVAGEHPSTKDLVSEPAPPAAKPAPPTSPPSKPEAPAFAERRAPETKPAPPPPPARPESDQQFLCPVCETAVYPDDKVCPGCGAEFSEGESTEYECPMCKAAVPADADHCPSCGVRFASEEPAVEEPAPEPALPVMPPMPAIPPAAQAARAGTPLKLGMSSKVAALRGEVRMERHDLPLGDRKLIARELPRLVNEVKPLLVSAKKIGVGIDDGKRLIGNAVEAGKRKEMEKAVRLISDARRSLDLAFVDYIGSRLESLASEVEAAGPGEATNVTRPLLDSTLTKLGQRDYDGAWESLQTARRLFSSQAKEYTEGRKILDATERLAAEVRSLGMDTRAVEGLLREGREAADRHDIPGSLRLAKQSQERLLQAVPEFVQAEMREARNTLLEMKVHGTDLSKSVVILKEASAHVKNEEWSEAIRFLKEFQKETAHAPPAPSRARA